MWASGSVCWNNMIETTKLLLGLWLFGIWIIIGHITYPDSQNTIPWNIWSVSVLATDMNSITFDPHRATTPKFPRYVADFKSFIVAEWWAKILLGLLCQSHPCLWSCGTNSIPLELDIGLDRPKSYSPFVCSWTSKIKLERHKLERTQSMLIWLGSIL